MRRIAALLIVTLAATACGSGLYQTDDFSAADTGDTVVFWRMAAGPSGFVGVGGPIQAADLAEDAGPLPLAAYHVSGAITWKSRNPMLGRLLYQETPPDTFRLRVDATTGTVLDYEVK